MMERNVRYFSPVLAILFLSVVLSCKTTAPVAAPAAQVADRTETPAAAPSQPDEGNGNELPQALPEASPEANSAEAASDKPDTALPPELPVEKKPDLPEPKPQIVPPPSAPSFRMTPSPPPQAVFRNPTPPPSPPAPQAAPPVVQPSPPPAQVPQQSVPPVQNPPPPSQSTPAPVQSTPPVQKPSPPAPPSFLKPAEPENPPAVRQPVPVPVNPLPELPARTPPETTGDQVVFSRVVRATVGQVVEVPFRGTGWVYLGELGNRKGIGYDSRRLDLGSGGVTEGQTFIFRAETAGTYILKFYKQDFMQNYIINDYVQVIVGDAALDSGSGRAGLPVDQGRVIAEPRWPPAGAVNPPAGGTVSIPGTDSGAETQPAPEQSPSVAANSAAVATPPAATSPVSGTSAPAAANPAAGTSPTTGTGNAGAAGSAGVAQSPQPAGTVPRPRQSGGDDSIVAVAPPQAAPPVSSAIPPDAAPADYVSRAKQEFDAGRIESALTIMDTMKQRYPSGTDEAWWLYGQLLEANSSSRDIHLALDYYHRLVKEYPQSPRAADAQRRIAYLERYYLNIR